MRVEGLYCPRCGTMSIEPAPCDEFRCEFCEAPLKKDPGPPSILLEVEPAPPLLFRDKKAVHRLDQEWQAIFDKLPSAAQGGRDVPSRREGYWVLAAGMAIGGVLVATSLLTQGGAALALAGMGFLLVGLVGAKGVMKKANAFARSRRHSLDARRALLNDPSGPKEDV